MTPSETPTECVVQKHTGGTVAPRLLELRDHDNDLHRALSEANAKVRQRSAEIRRLNARLFFISRFAKEKTPEVLADAARGTYDRDLLEDYEQAEALLARAEGGT